QKDWAILQLNSPLGDKMGFLPVRGLTEVEAKAGVMSLAGYSGDWGGGGETAGIVPECRIQDVKFPFFYHDCDTSKGASGAPLMLKEGKKYTAIALNSSECNNDPSKPIVAPHYDFNIANVAIDFNSFMGTIKEAMAEAQKKNGQTFLQLCHDSWAKEMKVVVAYPTAQGWQSKGWITLLRGKCLEVPLGENVQGVAWVGVKSEINSRFRSRQGQEFCINEESENFTINKADGTCAPGEKKVVFAHKADVAPDKWVELGL
ncbi:MAG: DUF1036 domain-containing protein, partial [Pseudomonadota bacterium]